MEKWDSFAEKFIHRVRYFDMQILSLPFFN